MVTSAIAIIVLITFLQNNQSNSAWPARPRALDADGRPVCVAVNFFLGRLYTHTMLYSLSIRRKVRRQGGSSGGMHTSGDVGEAPIDLSGIRACCFPGSFTGADHSRQRSRGPCMSTTRMPRG
jgi:hypothetical protein